MSIICEGEIMDNVIDEFGSTVTIREITKSYNENDAYSDPTCTNTDTNAKALINVYTLEHDGVKEGLYEPGEITAMFKTSDNSKIKVKNQIYYDSTWFKIIRVRRHILADTVYVVEATVQRYST